MPATSAPLFTLPIAAAAALTEFRAIGYDGDVAGAGLAMFGIATTGASAGDQVAVDVLGSTIVEAGGAFAVGDQVEVGGDGKLVVYSAGVPVGRALQAASGDGDKVEVLLLPS